MKKILRGISRNFSSIFLLQNLCFHFKCLELSLWIFLINALSNFESQISSNKWFTEVRIFCFVNKVRVLLLSTYVLYCKWFKFQIRYNLPVMLLFFVHNNYLWTHWISMISLSCLQQDTLSKGRYFLYFTLYVNK